MTQRITDGTLREAHAWYMAGPGRTLDETAVQYGVGRNTLDRRWPALGLRAKPRRNSRGTTEAERRATKHEYDVTRRAVRREARKRMVFGKAVGLFREGKTLGVVATKCGLRLEAVGDILRDAGEACVRCGILLRATAPEGVAVLATGERVCQACVEEAGYPVARWEREPVQIVREYAEIGNWRDGEEGTCDG